MLFIVNSGKPTGFDKWPAGSHGGCPLWIQLFRLSGTRVQPQDSARPIKWNHGWKITRINVKLYVGGFIFFKSLTQGQLMWKRPGSFNWLLAQVHVQQQLNSCSFLGIHFTTSLCWKVNHEVALLKVRFLWPLCMCVYYICTHTQMYTSVHSKWFVHFALKLFLVKLWPPSSPWQCFSTCGQQAPLMRITHKLTKPTDSKFLPLTFQTKITGNGPHNQLSFNELPRWLVDCPPLGGHLPLIPLLSPRITTIQGSVTAMWVVEEASAVARGLWPQPGVPHTLWRARGGARVQRGGQRWVLGRKELRNEVYWWHSEGNWIQEGSDFLISCVPSSTTDS